MSLVVVIVNYRTPALVVDSLETLQRERDRGEEFSVIVVDGGSSDDSVAVLSQAIARRRWDCWVQLIALERNLGFAYANNVAIREALADPQVDAVWLLNPDTLVRPGAIRPLLEALAERDEIGIVGSRLEDPDGTPQRSAFRFPTLRSEIEDACRLGVISWWLRNAIVAPPVSAIATATDWIAGASMMVRAEVFRQIGLLDDNYFMYFEETEFCHRAAEAGWGCWYEPRSRVVHLVGQASGVTGESKTQRRRPGYWFESRRRYFLQHAGPSQTMLADAAWLSGRMLWYLMQILRQRPIDEPPRMWLDFLSHSVRSPPRSPRRPDDSASSGTHQESTSMAPGATA